MPKAPFFPSKKTTAAADIPASVNAIRGRISAAFDRRGDIACAPASVEEVTARVAGIVDGAVHRARSIMTLSDLARPDATEFALGLGDEGPSVALTGNGYAPTGARQVGMGAALKAAPLGVFAIFLGRDAVLGQLAALTAPLAENGLAPAERAAQLADVDAEILELERVEESLIRDGEAIGLIVPRRGDANPAIVLAVDLQGELA